MKAIIKESDILATLKAASGCYISGQAISEQLGVSRTAIWKHIGALRKAGYEIEGHPKKGYLLTAQTERPYNALEVTLNIPTEFIGKEVLFFDELDSTNTKASKLAREGVVEGTVVIAESQSKGRGRIERSWYSPPGANIYTSIILRPKLPPQATQTITLVSAVALAEAIEETAGVRPSLKWPNDILVGGKKVAGILTEMSSESDRVKHIIIGIGINVNIEVTDLPGGLRYPASSLKHESGSKIDRTELVRNLYSRLEKWYKILLSDGSEEIVETWREYFTFVGKEIRIEGYRGIGAEPVITEGICLGIDSDGALLIKERSGAIERVVAGDMT